MEKWDRTPILVSFDSDATPIWEIPFPSLTICNMNKIRRPRVERIERKLREDPTSKVDRGRIGGIMIATIAGAGGKRFGVAMRTGSDSALSLLLSIQRL